MTNTLVKQIVGFATAVTLTASVTTTSAHAGHPGVITGGVLIGAVGTAVVGVKVAIAQHLVKNYIGSRKSKFSFDLNGNKLAINATNLYGGRKGKITKINYSYGTEFFKVQRKVGNGWKTVSVVDLGTSQTGSFTKHSLLQYEGLKKSHGKVKVTRTYNSSSWLNHDMNKTAKFSLDLKHLKGGSYRITGHDDGIFGHIFRNSKLKYDNQGRVSGVISDGRTQDLAKFTVVKGPTPPGPGPGPGPGPVSEPLGALVSFSALGMFVALRKKKKAISA